MPDYWNHNTAYHRWLVGIAGEHRGDVLDVGCGDGLLTQRLLPVSRSVTGIDPDPDAVRRAQVRLAGRAHVSISQQSFPDGPAGTARFDLITFVATLHHMALRESLRRARELLRPGGDLAVVGLSANKSASDWIWAGLCLPVVRIGSRLHSETRDIGVVVAQPSESLREIRSVSDEVIPGAVVRRALYYRYLLRWRKPA